MVVFPNAKINLGLQILNKREDGYHNLESIFYPVDLCDILEIIKADAFAYRQTGLPIEGESENNLVVKAYRLLEKKYGIGPVSIHLHKVIPTGAGLGGGSSDASHALKVLDDLFDLQLGETELLDLALQLGSDCPFFICNVPCRVTGRGENLQKIDLSLKGNWIKILHPGIHVSTRQAFLTAQTKNSQETYQTIDYKNTIEFKNRFSNDFEQSVFAQYPILSELKAGLIREGAWFASMSGSGSAIYGIFASEPVPSGMTEFEYIGRLEY